MYLFIYAFIYIYGHFNIIYVELILNSASASRFCHMLARPVCTVSIVLYSFLVALLCSFQQKYKVFHF